MKLYDRPRTQETLDRLPELPEDVKIPDDISGLQPPTTLKPTTGGIRWMRWLAAIVVFGAVGVMAALIFSGGTTEIDQADVYGSDRHLTTWEDLANNRAIDYMALYGTDNPVFVQALVADQARVDAAGHDRHLATWEDLANNRAIDNTATDTPAVVREATQDTGLYLELYGTDNPVFVETVPEAVTPMFGPNEGPGSNSLAPTMPEPAEHPYADFFG